MANPQITSLTEKLQPRQIGDIAGAIKSPNFKYSVLGTIFGRKTSRKNWMQLVAGIKNPTPRNSMLGLIFGNNQFKNSTQIGTGQTAAKLKPLEQGNEFIDGLLKIYTFMRKTHDEDVLRREEEANFREEKLLEEKRRHDKLVDSIEKLKKSLLMMAYSTQSQKMTPEDTGPNIVPVVMQPPSGGRTRNKPTAVDKKGQGKKSSATKVGQGGKTPAKVKPTATRMSRTLRSAKKMIKSLSKGIKKLPAKFLGSAGVLAGITNLVMDISSLVDKRENDEIGDKELHKGIVKAIGAATAGAVGAEIGAALGSFIFPFVGTIFGGIGGYLLGSKYGETIGEKLFDYFDRGGSSEPAEQSEEEKDLVKSTMGMNETEQSVVQSTPFATKTKVPKATGAALSSGSPKGTMSERLSSAIKENNNVKLDSLIEAPVAPTINNVQSNIGNKAAAPNRVPMPPVRNLEESFQKSMIYSTRVV